MASSGLHARLLGSLGALLAAASVALGAYASHAAVPGAARRLAIAAAFGFGHGLALLALSPGRTPGLVGLYAIAAGTLAFAGSLALAALAGTGTALAPAGGMAMIAGWLAIAASRARR